jgi:peptidoglycan/LPS O-acetylase OafA/YrhL
VTDRTPPTARQRLDALDGLRGIAIVAVVVSHSWTLWSFDQIDQHGWARALFRNGDAAVSVFLVASGFLAYRALQPRGGSAKMLIGVTLVRRVMRVGPTLWLMLAVVALVAAVDPTDKSTWADNRRSALHAITYTYNWFVQDHLLQARYDLGHLWYLSVDMQAFVAMALMLYALRRRPVGIVFAVAACYLVLVWWRFHVTGTELPLQVLVRTTARMDAFVIGVLAAAVAALLARRPLDPRAVRNAGAAAMVALVPLFYWCASDPRGDGDQSFLTWGGTLLELDLAVLVGAMGLGATGLASGVTRQRALLVLGQSSLVVYVWHYPVFGFFVRHTHGWAWWTRGALALLTVAVICVVADRVVERPVRGVLRSPRWRQLDDGIFAFVSERLRGLRSTSGADDELTPGVELDREHRVRGGARDVDLP